MIQSPVSNFSDAPDTRRRLLEAAGSVFAHRGFRDATVREICSAASANVAAVNYHFGDKQGLYSEVMAFAFRVALERYPFPRPEEHRSPADRLAAFIRMFVARILDHEGRPAWHGQLMAREMIEPTGALDRLADEFMRPQYRLLGEIVADLLGSESAPERVRLCCSSIIGQCVFYKHARPVIDRLMPEQRFDADGRAEIAAHITAFSLAAIGVLRSAPHQTPAAPQTPDATQGSGGRAGDPTPNLTPTPPVSLSGSRP